MNAGEKEFHISKILTECHLLYLFARNNIYAKNNTFRGILSVSGKKDEYYAEVDTLE